MEPPTFPRLTGTAEVSVRPARGADAAAMARVQAVTWRAAFRQVLPVAVLDDWDETAAAEAWRAAATDPPTPAHGVLVALENGTDGEQVVGLAAYGPAEITADGPPAAGGPTTELVTLLVEPRWGRRGHGSRLLAAVADLVAGTGARRLVIWIPEADQVTGGFLESAGWASAGWVRTLDTGEEPLRERYWHTELDGSR